MKEWLTTATEATIVIIDFMALAIVLAGTIMAFVSGTRMLFSRTGGHERRMVWLTYARWLVAALTFQLAADIIESTITTSWDAVGRLAAIAAIRTFLNYFLERDLSEVRAREAESAERSARGHEVHA